MSGYDTTKIRIGPTRILGDRPPLLLRLYVGQVTARPFVARRRGSGPLPWFVAWRDTAGNPCNRSFARYRPAVTFAHSVATAQL